MIIAVRLALEIVRVDEQNRSACSAGQCARLLIDRIAKRLDRLPHFLARLLPNFLLVVQDPRNGNARDPCRPCDVIDRCLSLAHARTVTIVRTGRNACIILTERIFPAAAGSAGGFRAVKPS